MFVTLEKEDTTAQAHYDALHAAIWSVADKQNFPKGLPEHIWKKGEETFTYVVDDKPVGYIHWRWELGVAYIFATGVHPHYQRQGIATALKLELENRARAKGCHKIFTETGLLWPSTKLNEKLGYETIVVLENHYGNQTFVLSQKLL